jgi:CRP/FNR family transcriptional regulator, cyclic AMP receptor protein
MVSSTRPKTGGTRNEKLLRKNPFFDCLSDEHMKKLQQAIRIRSFHRNEVILHEAKTCQFMYVVFSGKVKVVHQSDRGKESILAFHKQGDCFGEMALLDGKTAPASVIAMEDSEVGLLDKADFEQTLLSDGAGVRHIIMMLCTRLRDSWMMLKVMSLVDAEQRVRAVIRHLGTLYGVPDQRGTIVTMKLTHKDIADHASVARETVSRLLKKFAGDNEIEVLDGKYLLLKPEFSRKMDIP